MRIGEVYFKTVPEGMVSLLLRATLPDFAAMVYDFGDEHIFYAAMLLFFIFLASLLVMNMLVGVLVEVVSVVSSVEKEQLQVSWVKAKLADMIDIMDKDGNEKISRDEFEALLLMPKAAKVIQELGVDVVGLVDLGDYIF